MSKELNKTLLTGRLGADPEMRFTPQGSPVTTFRLAVGRTWKSADGVKQQETEWFRIVAWNKLAEVCHEYLSKGSHVLIEGRLQTRHWVGDDGQEHATTEIIANDMVMLDSRKTNDTAVDAPSATETTARPSNPPTPKRQRTSPTQRKAPLRRSARQTLTSAVDETDLPF